MNLLGWSSTQDSVFTHYLKVFTPISILLFFLFVFPWILIKIKKTITTTYEFDDWGMRYQIGEKSWNHSWSEIESFFETGELIILKLSTAKWAMLGLNKQAFDSPDRLRSFLQLLSENEVARASV